MPSDSRIFAPRTPDPDPPEPPVSRTPSPEEPAKASVRQSPLRWLIPIIAVSVLAGTILLAFAPQILVKPTPELTWSSEGRLAVLPMINRTGDTEHGWIRLGLAEVVAEGLKAHPGILVVRPQRLFDTLAQRNLLQIDETSPRGRLRQLAMDLGAPLVLEATVSRTRSPNILREHENPDYTLDYLLWDRGKIALESRITGQDPIDLGYQLIQQLATALRRGSQPLPINQLLSTSPFLNRLYAMGLALRRGSPDDARDYFEICLRHQPSFLMAKIKLADIERHGGQLESAKQLLLEVLQESQKRADQKLQATVLHQLAEVAQQDDKAEEAQRLYAQASAIWMHLGDHGEQNRVLDGLVASHLETNDPEPVPKLLEQTLESQNQQGDVLGGVDTLVRLGHHYLTAKDLETAAQYLDRAEEAARQLGDSALLQKARVELANLSRQQGDLERATALWREAADFYQQNEDPEQRLMTSRLLAQGYLQLNDLERAEEAYYQLKSMAVVQDDLATEGLAALRLAQILLRRGYPRQARRQLDRALELDTHVGEHITLQLTIAWLAYEQGNYRLAVETQLAAKRQAAGVWGKRREAFLKVFQQALAENRRLPLPGEPTPPQAN